MSINGAMLTQQWEREKTKKDLLDHDKEFFFL
jgi:hypothetical protein